MQIQPTQKTARLIYPVIQAILQLNSVLCIREGKYMPHDLETILKDIDTLWEKFFRCRAHFPCVSPTMEGQRCVPTAPFYAAEGLEVTYVLNQELTIDIINKMNDIGHWLNQNLVVRLYAILDYHNVVDSIEEEFEGWRYVSLTRWLRRYFTHQSSFYNPNDSDHKKTMEEIGDLFNIDIEGREEFPLLIDKVLHPLIEGCKKYVCYKLGSA